MTRHLHVVGKLARDRKPLIEQTGRPFVFAFCHKGLRGPYTGVDTLLAAILPDAQNRWPQLVAHHRMEILEGMPELSALIGPAPRTLANDAPFSERTRWYEASLIRCLTQGIVTFLRDYARQLRAVGEVPPTLVLDAVHSAEMTTQEFVALFLRRVDAALWPMVVGSDGDVEPQLALALAEFADSSQAETAPEPPQLPAHQLALEYVRSDGTLDDPAAHAAYLALDPAERAALHDDRAQELERDQDATWGVKVSALPYHRERGSDPPGAGVAALSAAIEYCTSVGFSHTAVDLGARGRALVDPDRDPDTYRKFSNIRITHLIALRRLDEALDLCGELRRRYALPLVHMTISYFLAMIHTRFAVPRDHEKAVEHQNNAIVVANGLPDPDQRLVLSGFQENGLALIEMHRGNLDRALELVESAIARLDEHLAPQQWELHRSQLVYNRARLLGAKGRHDEAHAIFTMLSEMDPHYTDYLSERAKIARNRGDLEAAVRDYDRAEELGPPFVELFHNRGSAFAELGLTERALADFDHVLDMEPGDADTLLSRAELLLGEGDLDRAASDVARGLDLLPGDPRLLCLRAMVHLAGGDAQQALPDFDAALAKDPDYPAALINRAVTWYQLDRPEHSIGDLTRAIELIGPDADLLFNRGVANAACARPADALADFDLALTLPDADRPELLYQRGRCLIETGQHAQAEADLHECLRLGWRVDEVEELLTH